MLVVPPSGNKKSSDKPCCSEQQEHFDGAVKLLHRALTYYREAYLL